MHSTVFNHDQLRRLSATDQDLFCQFSFGERVETPFTCVHHAFEHHAQVYPDSIAVEDFQQKITYATLDLQSNCLATRLRAMGISSTSRICLLAERSIYMVIGILGILKAGAAYIPLDGNIVSDSTLDHALHNSGSSLVLAQQKFADRVKNATFACLEDSLCSEPSAEHCLKPEDFSKANDSAYIIYTSGKSLATRCKFIFDDFNRYHGRTEGRRCHA